MKYTLRLTVKETGSFGVRIVGVASTAIEDETGAASVLAGHAAKLAYRCLGQSPSVVAPIRVITGLIDDEDAEA